MTRAAYGCVCALSAGIFAASAQATFIHFDINAISVDAGEAFNGESHTGTLNLSLGATSSLNAIEVDGSNTAVSESLGSFDGEVILLNGSVVGGYIAFTAQDGSEYIASIASGVGAVDQQAGRGFRVDGLTNDGVMEDLASGTMFAGVDISKMLTFDPIMLDGSFHLHGFGPNALGLDSTVDIDIYANAPVPSPGPAALAVSAGILGGARRRRSC